MRQGQKSVGKWCDYERCNRSTWEDTGFCFWHAEVAEKPVADRDEWPVDIEGAYLNGVDLEGARLPEIRLWGADLSDACLRGAILHRATLRGANLTNADLTGIDLDYANLMDCNAACADLTGADLSSTCLAHANLENAVLARAKLNEADLWAANLTDATLSNAVLSGTNLVDATLTDADLDGAVIATDIDRAEFGYEWVTPDRKLTDVLRPTPYTPHTYWELPKAKPNSFFYYFTSREYRQEDSKYRLLDETLLTFGAFGERREVVTLDRSCIPNPLWDSILAELEIDNWPALAISKKPLGFEKLSSTDTSFALSEDRRFVKLESGVITDRLLSDPDELKQFLNSLHEGAKENDLKRTMQKKKCRELLNIGGKKIEDVVINSL
ncbi:pentapeptide repeat-containing protein [Natrarchaeobius oligotrophus]|nr:pentapeptide repeat-containing protein [Natrarchaeobius chitinivorans]